MVTKYTRNVRKTLLKHFYKCNNKVLCGNQAITTFSGVYFEPPCTLHDTGNTCVLSVTSHHRRFTTIKQIYSKMQKDKET